MRGYRKQPPCRDCGLTEYEHHDHYHEKLTRERGKCPFGDCGTFIERLEAAVPSPEGREGE